MRTEPESKEEYVERLFTSIAPRYDLLNSVLSFNCHKRWRSFATRKCDLSPGDAAIDVCAGTMDFAIELSRAVGPSGSVVGVDFCRSMLDFGIRKIEKRGIGNISVVEGNAERLPVPSNSFDAATIGFALRNVADVENTLEEMARAVKPGGRVVCLELASPEGRLFGGIYKLYFYRILPFIGGVINGRREPYEYLPASVASFYSGKELLSIMKKIGLDTQMYRLTGGIVTVHVGVKR